MNVSEGTTAKAARLYNSGRVHQTTDGLYFVEGDHGNYKVELRTADVHFHGTCDCPSNVVYCSHILAAMLLAKDRA